MVEREAYFKVRIVTVCGAKALPGVAINLQLLALYWNVSGSRSRTGKGCLTRCTIRASTSCKLGVASTYLRFVAGVNQLSNVLR